MNGPQRLIEVLEAVASGETTADDAAALLRLADEQLDFATLDHDRADRCGNAEVVFAAGKTPEQVVAIGERLIERGGHALITRCDAGHADAIEAAFTEVQADVRRRTLLIGSMPEAGGTAIPIITAGTSDQPVADEAALTFAAMGQRCTRVTDVGVAGIHRLLNRLDDLKDAGVIVCIAGMEGALPSVVGGLVAVPVIAVPTSIGYGAALNGVAALLGMLTSCASGVTVVNIDNGFGAAHTAALIQRQIDRHDHG